MKKYTIEDLAARNVATFIKDKSEIPDLERLLRLAFPEDSFDNYLNYLKVSFGDYYFAGKEDNKFWSSFRETDLPTQHVKDFLIDLGEWEPKPGEIFLVNRNGEVLELEFIVKADKLNRKEGRKYLFYSKNYDNIFTHRKEDINPLPPKVKLTLKEIADKFGIDVDRLEVIPDI